MGTDELGTWDALPLASVVEQFTPAGFRWWVSGGHALELHLGRSWRDHDDIDVGVSRGDVAGLRVAMPGWDLHIAAAGRLTTWRDEPLDAARHQNNIWCRRSPDEPWALDVLVGEGTATHWIYRRDHAVRVPWELAVLRTPDDVPYLAPELQLLYKSNAGRPKDHVDANEVIPALAADRRARLSRLLGRDHPWQHLIP